MAEKTTNQDMNDDLSIDDIGAPSMDRVPAGREPLYMEAGQLDLETVFDIPVEITVILGQTVMPLSKLLELGTGSVIELNKKVGEPVDVYVNNRLVARGEVVIIEDHIGVTMTEIIKVEQHRE